MLERSQAVDLIMQTEDDFSEAEKKGERADL
jgi:hypothetical protein